jgi:hypothetical protein
MIGAAVAFGLGVYGQQQAGKANKRNLQMQNSNIKLNNLLTVRETALEISGLLAGQTTLRNQAADAYKNAERAGVVAKASAGTEAAAAGVQGASIDAVQMDIDREVSTAEAEIAQSLDIEQFNMSQRLRGLVASRKAQLGQLNRIPSSSDVFNQAVITSGLQVLDTYASSLVQFGGTKQTTK